MAPVGQASAQRRAAWRRPSESGAPKGTATATSKPRPTIDSPSSSPASGRDPHAGVAQDALAGLVDDLRVGACPARSAASARGSDRGRPGTAVAQRRRPQPAAFEQPQLRQRSASRRAGSSRRPWSISSKLARRRSASSDGRLHPLRLLDLAEDRGPLLVVDRPQVDRDELLRPRHGPTAEVLIDGDRQRSARPPPRAPRDRSPGPRRRRRRPRAGWWRGCGDRPRCPGR